VKQNLAKVLEDVELGKVSRRQTLNALGLWAAGVCALAALPRSAAAFAFGAAQSPAAKGKSFPVTTVNHLSYATTDYVKTRDWYVDLFGMTIAWDDGKGCALEFGDPVNGLYLRNVAAGAKPTINHFAFGIENIVPQLAAMKAEMERRGLKNIRPDGEHGWIADDPAGYMLNTWVPVKDAAMFPGAAAPCAQAASAKCKDAYQAGLKNLASLPKPSGRGFKATSFSHIVLNVPEATIPAERDFYRDLLGMKQIYDQPADAAKNQRPQVFLRFGRNTLYLRPTPNPADKPYCNHFAFVVDNYDQDKVEAELKRRGLNPKPDSKLAWTIADPDGMRIEVAGWGLPEHIANDCRGSNANCPGGVKG
jgi:catechol 2,3-dioxygenase-like lactoylglutathione lyase family enzyme